MGFGAVLVSFEVEQQETAELLLRMEKLTPRDLCYLNKKLVKVTLTNE